MNKDGRLDVVFSAGLYGETGMVRVLLNTPDGRFSTPPAEYAFPGGASGLALLDYDRDGDLDFVVSNPFAQQVSLGLNRGDGTFLADGLFTGTHAKIPDALAVGDLNNDGRPDVTVLCNPDDAPSEINFFSNPGGGQKLKPETFGALPDVILSSIAIGKLDTDGNADLAVTYVRSEPDGLGQSVFAGYAAVFIGQGNFQPIYLGQGAALPLAAALSDVLLADLDEDGTLDIATSGSFTGLSGKRGSLRVFYNRTQAAGTFSEVHRDLPAAGKPFGLGVSDLNHDLRPDLIVANLNDTIGTGGDTDGTLQLYLHQQPGQPLDPGALFPSDVAHTPTFRIGQGVGHVATGDLNGDGIPDIALVQQGITQTKVPGSLRLFLSAGGS